eukprot:scaffold2926_cov399-Prasinococcus_capsulatus_cf.AAC.1
MGSEHRGCTRTSPWGHLWAQEGPGASGSASSSVRPLPNLNMAGGPRRAGTNESAIGAVPRGRDRREI